MIDKNKAIKNGIKVIDSREVKNEMFDNLKNNFPQSIKDGKVDLNAITQLLGLKSQENIGGYELTFTGKGLANALYNSPCEKELKLDEIFTINETAKSNNIIIKGDNLDALKILKSAYSGKIKMIYIDPPYNTLSDNFIYPDNFREDFKAILREVGLIETHENGQEVESENLKFFKNITGARTHSAWLAFMLPRLKLARDLLKDDGVIFISIDDNEQANLKLLCDEIFGEDNFVSNIIWNSINSVLKQSNFIRKEHEYILCYAKNKDNLIFNKLENTMEFQNIDNDSKGEWFNSNAASPNQNSNKNKFAITLPDGTECVRNWKFTYDEFVSGKVNLYFKGGNVPRLKIYKSEYNLNTRIESSIFKELGSITTAKSEIRKILGNDDLFDTPKPIKLIKHLLKISTSANQNEQPDIILDFFAGSGTTAHAVMELNSEDKANRKFILVQIPEPIDEKKSKTAFDFCKNELKSESPAISDITIERVKRAGKKLQDKVVGVENLGFKVFALGNKPKIFEKENSGEEKILELIDRQNLNKMDIITNMSLISGKTLDKKIETIFDGKLYKLEDSYYLINCDREILKYLTKTKNEYIFIDAYGDMELEDFLNLGAEFKERLKVVY